jgi:hypothetical protein
MLVFVGAIGCDSTPAEPECTTAADCFRDDVCVNGACIPPEGRDGGPDAGEDDAGASDAGEDDAGAGADATTDANEGGQPAIDVLVVLDSSTSMVTAQVRLGVALPDMVRALATGEIIAGEAPSFEPFTDIRAGVITVDLGIGPFSVPSCTPSGDDAALLTEARSADCGVLPPWLEYEDSMLARFREDFACKARVGTRGCGFEQQLEAALRAVTPSESGVDFFNGQAGQADRDNAGFLRDGAVLVVLIVTDEDDCSTADPELFDPESTRYASELQARCIEDADALRRISRYADGFAELGKPLVFSVLAGIPLELDGSSPAAILADPRMEPALEGGRPVNVCAEGEAVSAGAAHRLVSTAAEIGAIARGARAAVVGSLCAPSYDGFVGRLRDAVVGLDLDE